MGDLFPSAGYIPVVQTAYFMEKYFSEEKYMQLEASGVIDRGTLDDTAKKGDFVNTPKLVQAAPFTRSDVTSTDTTGGTRISSNAGKLPVLRDVSINKISEHDDIRTGENFEVMLASSAGNQMAKRTVKQLDRSLKGALGAITTHTRTTYPSALTVQAVRQCKAQLGDQGQNLHTMLVHSKVWFDLVRDLIENYKYMGVTSGKIIEEGKLDTIMGIRNIIISDDLIPDAGTGSSTLSPAYNTYLLGEKCIYQEFQRLLNVQTWSDVRVQSTLHYVKFSMDYVLGPTAVKFSGSANPADDDFANSSNWAISTEDLRNANYASIVTVGGKFS